MTKPKRIQRKRTLGWRKPSGVINVSRPSKWGNPYAVRRVRRMRASRWIVIDQQGIQHGPDFLYKCQAIDHALALFRAYIEAKLQADPHCLDELKGHDLMCFCREGDLCHGSLLVLLANPEDGNGDTAAG